MVKFERLSGLWNYRLSRPTETFFFAFFNVFFQNPKKRLFTFFGVASDVFSNTGDDIIWTFNTHVSTVTYRRRSLGVVLTEWRLLMVPMMKVVHRPTLHSVSWLSTAAALTRRPPTDPTWPDVTTSMTSAPLPLLYLVCVLLWLMNYIWLRYWRCSIASITYRCANVCDYVRWV